MSCVWLTGSIDRDSFVHTKPSGQGSRGGIAQSISQGTLPVPSLHISGPAIGRLLCLNHFQCFRWIEAPFPSLVQVHVLRVSTGKAAGMFQVYKDDNHKPEMAIAISDFEALCGFITAPELAEVLERYPEIQPCLKAASLEDAVSSSGQHDQKAKLRQLFTSLMTCDRAKVTSVGAQKP